MYNHIDSIQTIHEHHWLNQFSKRTERKKINRLIIISHFYPLTQLSRTSFQKWVYSSCKHVNLSELQTICRPNTTH